MDCQSSTSARGKPGARGASRGTRRTATNFAVEKIRARAGLVRARTGLVNTARGLAKSYGERLRGCNVRFVDVCVWALATAPISVMYKIEVIGRSASQHDIQTSYDRYRHEPSSRAVRRRGLTQSLVGHIRTASNGRCNLHSFTFIRAWIELNVRTYEAASSPNVASLPLPRVCASPAWSSWTVCVCRFRCLSTRRRLST
jgi:hypothetical protein